MKVKRICLIMFISLVLAVTASPALAEWNYGIGTGFSMLNIDGDIGFNTNLLGPVKADVELDPEDVSDLMESAFGLSGYATDGTWMVHYSFGMLELEGNGAEGGVTANIDFKTTGGELTVGYPVYKSSPLSFSLLGGLRYTDQELSTRVSNGTTTLTNDVENDWVDAVVGAGLDVQLAQNWDWNTQVDAGFGGSEGTYTGSTGVTWRFLEHWSGTLFAQYAAVEFEEGNRGDNDWYLYDVDETTAGLTILYHW